MTSPLMPPASPPAGSTAPVYVVSGGTGSSGEQLLRTALAQFSAAQVPVVIIGRVREEGQIKAAIEQASASGGIIVHTLVDEHLRHAMINLAQQYNVVAIDLIGQMMLRLTTHIGQQPLGQPGLYRQLRSSYFKRLDAIDFAVEHDDGRRASELRHAEIVLIGVSRVGKTPLSMYLSTQGWKVANVPLVPEVTPPPELFQVERQRVVGLTMEIGQLINHRRSRQEYLGVSRDLAYANVEALEEEMRYAKSIFRRGRFAVIDITDKPIEESANAVIAQVTRHMKS